MTDFLDWVDTDLATADRVALLFYAGALFVAVPLLVWTFWPARWRRPRCNRSPAADEPSGPIVPAAELFPAAVWIDDVDRRHPEPWAYSTRHQVARRPRSTVAACDRTTVDLARIVEDVPS